MKGQTLEQARPELGRAINWNAKFAPAYISMAEVNLNTGNNEMAIVFAEQAKAINPNLPWAKLVFGSAYGNKRDAKSSKNELEGFVTLAPGSELGHYRLGPAY